MKPANLKKIEILMEHREELIILQNKFKSCKGNATEIGPDANPEISLSVNVTGAPATYTLKEDYEIAMKFVTNYIISLQQRIDMVTAQLKPL